MLDCAIICLSLAAAGQTAAPDTAPPAPQAVAPADVPVTGTPSNANATVSTATVAEAMARPDVGARGGDTSAFDISLGASIAHGDFGSGYDSRIFSSALGARFAVDTLRLSASIPYLNIRSSGIVFSGIDATPILAAPPTAGRRITAQGIGDLTLGAAYTIPFADSAPEIEFSARVKIPTASASSGLSTGKADFSGGVQITKPVGKFAPFVSATYRVFGDPAIIKLKNGFAASAGSSLALGGGVVALASYHYAQAASALMRDSHELFAGLSGKIPGSRLRLTGFATAGLSSGAAASSGGLSLSIDF